PLSTLSGLELRCGGPGSSRLPTQTNCSRVKPHRRIRRAIERLSGSVHSITVLLVESQNSRYRSISRLTGFLVYRSTKTMPEMLRKLTVDRRSSLRLFPTRTRGFFQPGPPLVRSIYGSPFQGLVVPVLLNLE